MFVRIILAFSVAPVVTCCRASVGCKSLKHGCHLGIKDSFSICTVLILVG
jgi:hypothetical protein